MVGRTCASHRIGRARGTVARLYGYTTLMERLFPAWAMDVRPRTTFPLRPSPPMPLPLGRKTNGMERRVRLWAMDVHPGRRRSTLADAHVGLCAELRPRKRWVHDAVRHGRVGHRRRLGVHYQGPILKATTRGMQAHAHGTHTSACVRVHTHKHARKHPLADTHARTHARTHAVNTHTGARPCWLRCVVAVAARG